MHSTTALPRGPGRVAQWPVLDLKLNGAKSWSTSPTRNFSNATQNIESLYVFSPSPLIVSSDSAITMTFVGA